MTSYDVMLLNDLILVFNQFNFRFYLAFFLGGSPKTAEISENQIHSSRECVTTFFTILLAFLLNKCTDLV